METEVLDDVGFTAAEKKIYLALLDLGVVTAAPILEKTGLQSSVVYRAIHRLIEKGFVSFIKKGKIKHYKAVDPDFLLAFLKEKEVKLAALIPKLKLKQKLSGEKEKEEAEIYSGFKGIKTMMHFLIEDAKEGEEYYFFGTRAEIYKELQSRVYLAYDLLRKEKQVKAFGIHHISIKEVMMENRYPQMRYVDFPIPQTMSIFRDKIAIVSWGNLENPIGVLITSKEIAEQYKTFFKEMWNIAKP